ncbi:MAG: alkane 1-monooxygenase, partial [Alphaproteobacteria bacterium]
MKAPMHAVGRFAIATLTPALLLLLATTLGGGWIWAAALFMAVVSFVLDQIPLPQQRPMSPERPIPFADALSVVLALVHFVLLALAIRALAAGGLGAAQWLALWIGAGQFFGQVSNANAHELIHRSDRRLFTLGKWVFISLLFGHHTSAHLKVHHRFAASPDDPNSARRGESFYRFAPRAWWGSFLAGYRAERADIRRRGKGGATPHVVYVLGAAGLLLLAGLAYGPAGIGAYLALAAYAQTQLLLSDYVQHYGLTRARRADGRLEPVGPQHSWNGRQWFTSALMLNAPRHSDHHAHPNRPYPQLDPNPGGQAPQLPASLPAIAVLALFPGPWRRVMGRE